MISNPKPVTEHKNQPPACSSLNMAPHTFVAFDLETTGLNPKRDAIIEFGAVRFQKGGPREYYSTCINPGRPLPVRIQQITGIRPEDVAGAPAIEEVVPEILGFFTQRHAGRRRP